MMESVKRINASGLSDIDGEVVYDPAKLLWNVSIILVAVICAPFTFTWSAFFLFIISTYSSLLVGHSVGMHRMMIHRTFECPKPVRWVLIYIGVLVGMSGPFGIIRIHDIRDWAQRKSSCPEFFSHRKNYLQDIWWQLTAKFRFKEAPQVIIEPEFANDRFIVFLEKTWRWHQLPVIAILFYWGGWSFVVWGVFLRIAVSIVGHWTITYFCHNPGPGSWRVLGAGVQASNISGLGLLTYGECWHNNHHAFPESAKIGLEKGQVDPAWWFILLLKKLKLANNIQMPRPQSQCEDLKRV
ncbi:fatty acid desaturase [Aliikangiella sp. IMCC44653]